MSELPSIEDRVSKGIAWLEEQGAYDWAEKIVAAVEASRFHMDCDGQCAVGTTLGSYANAFWWKQEHLSATDGSRHQLGATLGFFDLSDQWDEYPLLEAEWERRARDHAAYRAEVLG